MRAQGNNRSRQYKRRNTKRVCGEEVGNDPDLFLFWSVALERGH